MLNQLREKLHQQSAKIFVCALICFVQNAAVHAQTLHKRLEQTLRAIVMLNVDYEGIPEYGAGIVFAREKNSFLIVTTYQNVCRGSINAQTIKVCFKVFPDI